MARSRSVAVGIALVVGSGFAAVHAEDALSQVRLTAAEAQRLFLQALNSGFADWSAPAKALKSAAPAARAATVRSLLGWAKAYSESAEFRAAYERLRESRKPVEAKPAAVSDELASQRAELDKAIAETKKQLAAPAPAGVPKDVAATIRQSMEQALQMLVQQRAQLDTPERQALMRQAVAMQGDAARTAHARDLGEWESRYPAEAQRLVAKRLREALAACADVDFAARLRPCGSLQCFADARYESKPREWKLCYRAGKETVETARAFATAWLAELPAK